MSSFDNKEQCDSCGGYFHERSMTFEDSAMCVTCRDESGSSREIHAYEMLQTACDLTGAVINAYIEEDNPNGFDQDGYPIVRDLGAPTPLEDAIHALTEWALNWHGLGEPPKVKNEAEYARAILQRVQNKYAPDIAQDTTNG